MPKFKSPTGPQFTQVGRHAADAMKSVAASMGLSLDEVQAGVIINPDLQPKFQQLLREMAEEHRLATTPHLLQRKPFDPEKFSGLGKGWKIVERIGQRVGNILDAGKISRKDYLEKGESYISGEKRLERIKANQTDIQLDGEDFLALYEEEGQKTLRWLHDTKGITWLSFWGIILEHPNGRRGVLCLDREDDGSWGWYYGWVDDGRWGTSYPSGVLAS